MPGTANVDQVYDVYFLCDRSTRCNDSSVSDNHSVGAESLLGRGVLLSFDAEYLLLPRAWTSIAWGGSGNMFTHNANASNFLCKCRNNQSAFYVIVLRREGKEREEDEA